MPRGVDETADEAGDTVGVGRPVAEIAVEKVVTAAELVKAKPDEAELDEAELSCAEAAPTAERITREETERILYYKRTTKSEKVVENVVDLDMTGIEGIASYFIPPSGRRLSYC